jgi:hypothetical protein
MRKPKENFTTKMFFSYEKKQNELIRLIQNSIDVRTSKMPLYHHIDNGNRIISTYSGNWKANNLI